ncbi:MAG: hypothetical protein AAF664_09900 [Planctomycetota bacterium]
MTMSSEDLVHHMAQDFSMFLGEMLALEDAPADEFFHPIHTVFGSSPTQGTVVVVFKSRDGADRLASELNSWLEVDSVTANIAKQLLGITITNNFGPDVIG